jgi:hypothetical protein
LRVGDGKNKAGEKESEKKTCAIGHARNCTREGSMAGL